MDKNLNKEVQNNDAKLEESNETTERLTVEVPTGVQAGENAVVCTCPPGCCG
jgi:hypothetical protein